MNWPNSKSRHWAGGVTAEEMFVRGTRTCRAHRSPTRAFFRLRRQTVLRGSVLKKELRELAADSALHLSVNLKWRA
jgi:hypothetical protein